MFETHHTKPIPVLQRPKVEQSPTTFTLEARDYAAMVAHLCRPAIKRSTWGGFLLGVLAGPLLIWLTSEYEWGWGFLFGTFAGILFMVFVTKRASSAMQRQFVPNAGGALLCEYSVTLTERGIELKTPHWSTLHAWSGVVAIERTPGHAFIRIDRVAAYAIPRRAFADEAAFERFVENCSSHLKVPANV